MLLLFNRQLHRGVCIRSRRRASTILLCCQIAIGAPLCLYSCKALALVLFQRKLLFMPYLPPGARSESLEDYRSDEKLKDLCIDPIWVTNRNIHLAGIFARPVNSADPHVLFMYVQGNGGNPLHRLHMFATVFRAFRGHALQSNVGVVAVAPRSYWRSSRARLSESGIVSDYMRILEHVREVFPTSRIVLWGHSLGAVAATKVAVATPIKIAGLVLETPFYSVCEMVKALYPQRWLPYRYLGVLAWDKFNAYQAASRLPRELQLLVLQAEKDELVPATQTEAVFSAAACEVKTLIKLPGALHFNCFRRKGFAAAMRTVAEKATQPLQLTLYVGGPGCRLCLEAEEELARTQLRLQRRGVMLEVQLRDLRGPCPEAIVWRHRWGFDIPVLTFEGAVIAKHQINGAQVENMIIARLFGTPGLKSVNPML